MPRRKLDRLDRLARLRRVEKLRAASQAAEAQGVHHKLLTLHQRSDEIARGLGQGGGAETGDDLLRRMAFASGLQTIRQETGAESRKAEGMARDAMAKLRAAERRHDVVGDQLLAEQRRVDAAAKLRAASELARNLKSS